MKFIILGAPGAGKGTQADKISNHYKIPHISTGDMFRENIKNKTTLGIKIYRIVSDGGLVTDEITNQVVRERLSKEDCKNGFILDGYPRTISQVKSLEEYGIELDYAIYIEIEDEVIIKRMSGRVTCPECSESYHLIYNPPKLSGLCNKCQSELVQREDDKPYTVTKRLDIFHNESQPILDFYDEKGILVKVNGDAKTEDITELIINLLEGE